MLDASSISALLKSAENLFKSYKIPEPKTDAEFLLAGILKLKRSGLHCIGRNPVSGPEFRQYASFVSRRLSRLPVSYITGKTEFMGLEFFVDRNVLIPRQETEILVEEAVNIIKKNKFGKVLDLCSGSGCIAVSVSKLCQAAVTASDISAPAVKTAEKNAALNGVSGKINFIVGDLFSEIPAEKFDIIISNPPYVTEKEFEKAEKELLFEPPNAFEAGRDGLVFYEKIAKQARKYLNKNGFIAVELNSNIPEKITGVFIREGYGKIKIIKDYSGLDRVLVLKNG